MPIFIILGIIVLLPIIFVVATYNSLIQLRNHISDAWGNIDTELKRRYNLIPNLVSTVKGYAAHEREVFEQVTELRNQCIANTGSAGAQSGSEQMLVGALQKLLAVVENYPQLKADGNFLQLQKELVNTEDRIQAARRFYNGNVRDYKNKCETFPSTIVAGMFGFESKDFFNVEPAVREIPKIEKFNS
ncbi:MAG: LemA family protein [Planctomycetes bacterium]|nr:LemA family protein [Planctomycetota bacterium]